MATILCIDDEPHFREGIATELRDTGYKVIEAGDGRLGLEMILYHKPDLVISDVIMRRMDGFQLLEVIRTQLRRPSRFQHANGAGVLELLFLSWNGLDQR